MGGGLRWVGFLGLALAGCQTSDSRDLGTNDELYVSPGYRTKLPGDRQVFVAPLRDARTGDGLPKAEGAYPIRYMSDAVWERPVVEMVHDILVDELEQSQVFDDILTVPSGEALVLVPSLERMYGSQQEMIEGARVQAETAIKVQIHGPADAAGNRTLLYEETFADRQGSPVSFKPPSILMMTGASLHRTMGRLVSAIDQSNVARSGVPMIDK